MRLRVRLRVRARAKALQSHYVYISELDLASLHASLVRTSA